MPTFWLSLKNEEGSNSHPNGRWGSLTLWFPCTAVAVVYRAFKFEHWYQRLIPTHNSVLYSKNCHPLFRKYWRYYKVTAKLISFKTILVLLTVYATNIDCFCCKYLYRSWLFFVLTLCHEQCDMIQLFTCEANFFHGIVQSKPFFQTHLLTTRQAMPMASHNHFNGMSRIGFSYPR